MQQPISRREYRRQCEYAAFDSRLDPYFLDPRESELLGARFSDSQRTDYLFVRNGILRLWTRNPLICVTGAETLETCTPRKVHTKLALFAHEWLARNGYINYGCLEISKPISPLVSSPKTILVLGAGVAGLACARQIQSLFEQFPDKSDAQVCPRIILLEGRDRIGGRVYSYPISTQQQGSLPPNLASTAEVGAQIILGFGGNPLNHIIRGQLALEHQVFSADESIRLFDADGSPVQDQERADEMLKLYNSLLDTTMRYSWKAIEQAAVAELQSKHTTVNGKVTGAHGNQFATTNGTNGINGGTHGNVKLLSNLGAVMDDLVSTNQERLSLTPLDLRLINWEFANFEYANGAPVNKISLGGWAQADGNEFEGLHSIIVGGYSQLPRALWKYPTALDVRLNKSVVSVNCGVPDLTGNSTRTRVECDDGSTYIADQVVCTLPLGVLKEETSMFQPPLPQWKSGAMHRLGFGLLNKVILIFDHVFWDAELNYFGILNQASKADSLDQKDYSSKRGKFFMLINCVKTSGRPMLVALIAGEAAHFTEKAPDEDVLVDIRNKLIMIFKPSRPPKLVEAIVTRWKRDRFARGSYSYLGPEALPDDYNDMAKPVGDLFFAGEATCGSYAATVHGAYLSGLRAASEVFDAIVGPLSSPKI